MKLCLSTQDDLHNLFIAGGKSTIHAIRGGLAMSMIGLTGYVVSELFDDWRTSVLANQLQRRYGKDYDISGLPATDAFSRVKHELTAHMVPLWEDDQYPGASKEGVNEVTAEPPKTKRSWFPIRRIVDDDTDPKQSK